jgi:hypothetical protein
MSTGTACARQASEAPRGMTSLGTSCRARRRGGFGSPQTEPPTWGRAGGSQAWRARADKLAEAQHWMPPSCRVISREQLIGEQGLQLESAHVHGETNVWQIGFILLSKVFTGFMSVVLCCCSPSWLYIEWFNVILKPKKNGTSIKHVYRT